LQINSDRFEQIALRLDRAFESVRKQASSLSEFPQAVKGTSSSIITGGIGSFCHIADAACSRVADRRILIPSWLKGAGMLKCASGLLAVSLLVSFGFAKEKKKNTLPAYVLSAHTVAVIIDPGAGMSIESPQANQDAQKNVEAALVKWGRFEPVTDTRSADLIIVLRKGNGRMAEDTMGDPGQNGRTGGANPMDNGVRMGGSAPNVSGQPNLGSRQPTDMGEANDSFVVFQGGVDHPLAGTPAWKYVARDGLNPQAVPAVAIFRKTVENADKAADAEKP
jgi:hypothetical protein